MRCDECGTELKPERGTEYGREIRWDAFGEHTDARCREALRAQLAAARGKGTK